MCCLGSVLNNAVSTVHKLVIINDDMPVPSLDKHRSEWEQGLLHPVQNLFQIKYANQTKQSWGLWGRGRIPLLIRYILERGRCRLLVQVVGEVSLTWKPKAPCSQPPPLLFHWQPKLLLSQPGHIVSPAYPESAPGPPPGWACLKHLPREVSRRHPKQMPEWPQLVPLNARGLHSKLLADDRTKLLTLSLRENLATLRRKLSSALCIRNSFFDWKLKIMGKSLEVKLTRKSRALPSDSFFATTDWFSVRITADGAPVCLSISLSVRRPLV